MLIFTLLKNVFLVVWRFFQSASSLRRSEGGPMPKRLWTLSAPGAGKGLFRPQMNPAPKLIGCYDSMKLEIGKFGLTTLQRLTFIKKIVI